MFAFRVSHKTAAWLAVALSCFAPGAVLAGPCDLQEMATLTIQRTTDGRVLVPVTVDEHPVSLMLDTGAATTSFLFEDTIAALNLHEHETADHFKNIEGRDVDHYVVLRSLDIARIHLTGSEFVALPRRGGDASIAGLMGPEIIRQLDLEIDPAANKIHLYSQKHCSGNVVYWAGSYADEAVRVLRSGHIMVPMMLDGKPVDALLDTGAGETLLSLPAAYRLFDLDSDSPGMSALSAPTADSASRLKRYRYPFKSLSMAGVAIKNPNIIILEDKIRRLLDKGDLAEHTSQGDEALKLPDLILGMNILSKLRLYIAYGEQHIYFTAADAK